MFPLFFITQLYTDMRYKRTRYVNALHSSLKDEHKRLILLTWPRDAGKTKILEYTYHSDDIKEKKRYYPFDASIVTKQFHDIQEFMYYMSIKIGVIWHEPGILMLNEIQYSKWILELLQKIVQQPSVQIKILATSVTDITENEIILAPEALHIIHIYPLDFFEFLEDKWMHTKYLSLSSFSKILIKEIQPLFDEYLIRWGYPAVAWASTQEEKRTILNNIVRKIFEKDAWFRFAKDHLLLFEEIISLLWITTAHGYKLKHFQKQLHLTAPTVQKYITFFEKNHLFLQIPHFFTDKTKEISHQKTIYCIDTWLVSFLTDSYSLKVKTPTSLANFIFQELLINKRPDDQIMTYKKINLSEIEFIVIRSDGEIIPISISQKDSVHPPKIINWFMSMYGHRVRHWIKLCPTLLHTEKKETYTMHCLPWCMSKFLYKLIDTNN